MHCVIPFSLKSQLISYKCPRDIEVAGKFYKKEFISGTQIFEKIPTKKKGQKQK